MQLCEWHMKYNVTSCRQYKYEHRNFRKASNSRWLTDHMAPIAWLWSARGIALSSDSLLACSNLQRNVSYQHVTSLWIHAFVLRCCSFWRKIVVNVFMIVLHFKLLYQRVRAILLQFVIEPYFGYCRSMYRQWRLFCRELLVDERMRCSVWFSGLALGRDSYHMKISHESTAENNWIIQICGKCV